MAISPSYGDGADKGAGRMSTSAAWTLEAWSLHFCHENCGRGRRRRTESTPDKLAERNPQPSLWIRGNATRRGMSIEYGEERCRSAFGAAVIIDLRGFWCFSHRVRI